MTMRRTPNRPQRRPAIAIRAGIGLIAAVVLSIGSAWISAIGVVANPPNLGWDEAYSSDYFGSTKAVWWVVEKRRPSVQTIKTHAVQVRGLETDDEWREVVHRWHERRWEMAGRFGALPLDLSPLSLSAAMPWDHPTAERRSARAVGRGWPLICLATIEQYESQSWLSTPVGRGIPLPRRLTRLFGPPYFLEDRALPLLPVWPGLTINTALYAGLIWSAAALIRRSRSIRRLRRNLCPSCAYSLAGQPTPGCPECGWKRNSSDTRSLTSG